MLASVDPTFKYYFCLHANETLLRLEHTPKLVIAAINGHCVGGGLEIAMAADIRIARKDAGKIGLPEVNLGVLPGTGGTQRLSRMVGKSKAIELMVTGNTFSFEEAQGAGHHQRHLRARRLHGKHHGVRPPVLSAEQSREGRGPDQARGADRLGDSDGVSARRLNARTSRFCSRAKMPKKAWPPTWRSVRQRSQRNSNGASRLQDTMFVALERLVLTQVDELDSDRRTEEQANADSYKSEVHARQAADRRQWLDGSKHFDTINPGYWRSSDSGRRSLPHGRRSGGHAARKAFDDRSWALAQDVRL